jgi:thiol-disulfide isomerase/thioredoxin
LKWSIFILYSILKAFLFFVVFSLFFLHTILTQIQAQTGKMVEDLYPGLASGALRAAILSKLPKGILLTAGDLIIKEADLKKVIDQTEPAIRKQLTQNAFFLLENMATKRMLSEEASKAGFKKGDEDQAIMSLLSKKIRVEAVSEEELSNFYNQNKEMLENAPLDEIRERLTDYLIQQKREEGVRQFILTLGKRTPIRLNEEWAKKHILTALNNPVDRARRSGKPTLVEFGAPGCAPCDQMKPILFELKKKFSGKLNILSIHVGQERVLGARFEIQVIPVQIFFDKNGREVFRHTGYFPQAEVEQKLSQVGML